MIKTIDFNGLAAGTIVDNEFLADGVTVSASGGSGDAMIFDTASPTGGDADLATENLGGVLIVSEDGDSSDPDDNARGGRLVFDFTNEVRMKSLTFLDIEETARMIFYDVEGNVIDNQFVTATGDGGQKAVELDVEGVARLEVVLNGSGAVDNLVFDDPTITGENTDPVANDDSAEVAEDEVLENIDVLGNDTDADGDPLTVTGATSPDGEVTINEDGTLNFTPAADFNGETMISYTIGDSAGGTDTGTVTVTVTPVNDDPVANDDASISPDGAPVTFDVLANDTDVDGDDLSVFTYATEDGNVDINDDGTLTFTPNAGFTGDANISYAIEDGQGGTASGTWTVTVGDGGSTGDGVVTGSDDGDVIDLAYDGDAEGDRIDNNDALLPGEGPQDDIVDALGGDDTITALEGDDDIYAGAGDDVVDGGTGDDIIYGDSTFCDVAPSGDNLIVNGSFEDTTGTTATGYGYVGDGEIPGWTETNGAQIDIHNNGRGNVDASDGDNWLDTSASPSIGAVGQNVAGVVAGQSYDLSFDAADGDGLSGGDNLIGVYWGGELVDTVDPASSDMTTYSYTVTGGAGDGSNRLEFREVGGNDNFGASIDNVSLICGPDVVEGGNDDLSGGDGADVIFGEGGDDTLTGGEGADTLSGGDDMDVINGGAGDVVDGGAGGFNADPELNTDYDILDLTGQGPFILEDVVTDGNGNGSNGTVVFVDAEGTPTGETIAYTEIEEIIGDLVENRAPDAVDDASDGVEDTAITVNLLANDTDVDGDALTVVSATVPADQGTLVDNGDGTVTFTPAADFNGDATISYTIEDPSGLQDSAVHTVNVAAVNDAPDAVDDADETLEDTAITVNLLANDTDVDGDALTVVSATVPADQGTLVDNGDGTVTFTPAADFNGDATITYTIEDGNGGTDTAQHVVAVTPVNDAPVAADDTASTTLTNPVTIAVLDNDTDVDGDALTVTDATSPDGDVAINDDGTITFTPTEGFAGEATISYTIEDEDGLTDTATVTVNVRDGIVSGSDDDDLIDADYTGDPDGDLVDNDDAILPGEEGDDDIIEAGDGNDTVLAGDGNDEVTGGDGDDSIEGGAGDDVLNGNDGRDTVNGGDGDDVIDTSSGEIAPDIGYPGVIDPDTDPENDRDLVNGGDGNDTITTGDDRDTITGGAGDDVINAGIDDDIVEGNDGDDRIVGGEGSDDILGGTGNDTIYAGNDPEDGLDGLNIEDDGSNPFGPDLRPENGRDTVDGGAGDDVIFGADDDDLLIGGSGDDYLDGEIDNDTLLGGTGLDTLIGGQGDDSLSGGLGDDELDGGIGDDTLRGNRDDDTLMGDDGNDLLDGGGQDDVLDGGDGDDTLQGATGEDSLDGGAGDDDLDGGSGDDTLNGGAGDDTLAGALGADILNGGDGDDVMAGGSGDDIFDGGAGDDMMTGGADRDNFVNVNAGDVVNGSETGDDFDCLDLTGSAPAGGRLEVEYADDNPENGTVFYFDEDNNPAGQLVFTNIEKVVPCFTPGTKIATPKGEIAVENLKVGDRVITRDNGIQDIRWIGHKEMTGEALAANQHMNPVLIRAGALGNHLPERDMMVSPNHRVLVANDKTALYFEEREVLVAAKHLTGLEGVDIVEVSGTTYIHVMFDQHEVILSDGTWSESFQPGDNSLAGVGDEQRAEILELFPELATRIGVDGYSAARRSLKKHEAKLLTKGH